MGAKRTSSVHYVDNKRMYKELFDWQADGCKEEIPQYVSECFIKISNRLTQYRRFQRYTEDWKSDMILCGIEYCFLAVKKFDSTRFKNPHAYFTKVVYNAFLANVKKEKKQQLIKNLIYLNNTNNLEVDEEHGYEFYYSVLEKAESYKEELKLKC